MFASGWSNGYSYAPARPTATWSRKKEAEAGGSGCGCLHECPAFGCLICGT